MPSVFEIRDLSIWCGEAYFEAFSQNNRRLRRLISKHIIRGSMPKSFVNYRENVHPTFNILFLTCFHCYSTREMEIDHSACSLSIVYLTKACQQLHMEHIVNPYRQCVDTIKAFRFCHICYFLRACIWWDRCYCFNLKLWNVKDYSIWIVTLQNHEHAKKIQ